MSGIKESLAKRKKENERKKLRAERVKAVAQASGLSEKEARLKMEEAEEKFGIKFGTYLKNEFWTVPDGELGVRYENLLKEKAKKKERNERIKKAAQECGMPVDAFKKKMRAAKEEHGVTNTQYLRYSLWEVPEEELDARYEKLQKESARRKERNRLIKEAATESGLSEDEIRRKMRVAKDEHGISNRNFFRHSFWKVPEEDWRTERHHILDRQRKVKLRKEYVREVALRTGTTFEEAKAKMDAAKEAVGVTYFLYQKYEFWNLSLEEQKTAYAKIREERAMQRNEEELEERATAARDELLLSLGSHDDAPFRVEKVAWWPLTEEEEKHASMPASFQAIAYLLGGNIPKDAKRGEMPSQYVQATDCSLEHLREILGEEILPKTSLVQSEYNLFQQKFKGMHGLTYTDTDMAYLYLDWIFFAREYGFNRHNYFEYRFYECQMNERRQFLSEGFRTYVRATCNTDITLFKDKAKFNAFFDDLVPRKWLDVARSSFEDFEAFVDAVPEFFAKPNRGGGGVGACIINSEGRDRKELFSFCEENGFILEEVVTQHPELAEFNKDTLNTMRIYTMVKADGTPRIMGALIRFGRVGSVVDNYMSGGVCALIDPETGIISTDSIDIKGNMSPVHPDSKKQICGFQVPEWEKVKETVSKAAEKCMHKNRHIGWDIGIKANGDIEIVEGNSWPDFDALQVPDQIGKMPQYEKDLRELAEYLGKPVHDNSYLDVIEK